MINLIKLKNGLSRPARLRNFSVSAFVSNSDASKKVKEITETDNNVDQKLDIEKQKHEEFKRLLKESLENPIPTKHLQTGNPTFEANVEKRNPSREGKKEKEAWERKIRHSQTKLNVEGEFVADPREADASKMFESQPGAAGIPLGRIKPVKKAFKRQPYVEPEDRKPKELDLTSETQSSTKSKELDKTGKDDTFAVLDSRLDDTFLINRYVYEHESARHLKTTRERLWFAYTRNREALEWPEKPYAIETAIINSEIRKAEFKQFIFRNLRKNSSRSLMYSYLPEKYQNLAFLSRFQSQTGTYMLFFPASFGLALSGMPFLEQIPIQMALLWGAFCLRSSAQILHQIRNYETDKKIHRQKSRPLATGAITHNQAYASLGAHLLGAAAVLPFLPTSCAMVIAGMTPLAFTLPTLRRFTNSEQVIQGSIIASGVFVGMAAGLNGYIDPVVSIPAFLSCLFWHIHYDTIYAFQDVDNDPLMANKSFIYTNIKPARKRVSTMGLADRSRQMEFTAKKANLALFYYGAAQCFCMAGAMCAAGFPKMIWVPYIILHTLKHGEIKQTLSQHDPKVCYTLFKKEQYYHLGVLFLVFILAPLLLYSEELRCNSLRLQTGGTMEYKAEFHHLMKIDRKVRVEDHLAWKEYMKELEFSEKVDAGLLQS